MPTWTIRDVQRRILGLAILITLITGLAVAVTVLVPMRQQMHGAAEASLIHLRQVKRMALSQFVGRVTDVAWQMTSRTQIRKRLDAYNRGTVGLEELRAFSAPRLKDALTLAGDAVGIVRFDAGGAAVVEVDEPIPEPFRIAVPPSPAAAHLLGPTPVDGRMRLVVGVPILERDGTHQGTDLLLFRLDALGRVLADGDTAKTSWLVVDDASGRRVLAAAPDGGGVRTVSPPLALDALLSPAAHQGVAVVDGTDGVGYAVSAAALPGTAWTLVVVESTATLYADAGRTLLWVAAVLIVLLAAGALVVWRMLRPLTGQVLIAAQDLENRLIELNRTKTALEKERQSLSQSNAELEQFAYIASHDLREPLRTITSFLNLLERRHGDHLPDEGKEFVGYAVSGARRMNDIITDLLNYSRVGRKEQVQGRVDLVEVMDLVEANLAHALEESGARLATTGLPVLSAAAKGEMLRLFQNLVHNAVRYRRTGVAPDIAVTAQDDGGQWHIRVADNGVGIDQRYHERVFGLFQRLEAKREDGGTGMGLAECRKIVEHHGGRIWLTGAEGEGTTVHIVLPKTPPPPT